MLTGSMKAAPRPWTLEGLSGGAPAGGGVLELASCGEGSEGFWGSSGKSSSAMIYMAIIGFFAVFLEVWRGREIGAEWVSHSVILSGGKTLPASGSESRARD